MKGIIFAELIEMVEEKMGLDIADRMIEGASTSTDGGYSSVGTYSHEELLGLVHALSEVTSAPADKLVNAFGQHLFHRLRDLYPDFFHGVNSALDFLPMVESIIHVEVRKLYPEAELPTFTCETVNGVFEMTYQSSRPFADLAEGMISSCVEHFGDSNAVNRVDLGDCDGTHALFRLPPIGATEPSQVVDQCQT